MSEKKQIAEKKLNITIDNAKEAPLIEAEGPKKNISKETRSELCGYSQMKNYTLCKPFIYPRAYLLQLICGDLRTALKNKRRYRNEIRNPVCTDTLFYYKTLLSQIKLTIARLRTYIARLLHHDEPNRIGSRYVEFDELYTSHYLNENYQYKGKVKHDLEKILGALQSIPTTIAPDEDKGIYLVKAIDDVKKTIKKYEVQS